MIEHKQLYLHKPAEKMIGDCFRACIACVLDMPAVDDVPHVYELVWKADEEVGDAAKKEMNAWLATWSRYRYTEYPLECSEEQLNVYLNHYYRGIHVILGCNSKHGGHSVVVKNGTYMWDPSIDNSGCVGPMKDGYYWIGLLVRSSE